MQRLSNLSVHQSRTAALPYKRDTITAGIVHLGIGAFHRAHQAAYIDACLATEPHWGIIGVSLRRPDMQDALAPQDGLYTLGIQAGQDLQVQHIGSVLEVIHSPADPTPVIDLMAADHIRIVSLTVTEKGYCHNPATAQLHIDHVDIAYDLRHPNRPRSALGLIVAALARRHQLGQLPFTVLSCDNLPDNGHTLRQLVLQYAQLLDKPDLIAWIEQEVAFPSSMVDRLVPATSPAQREQISQLTGLHDAWPVITEPFSQWVIEDNFCDGRPDFASHGVELVTDVKPFEDMKLRLLNGSHSVLAYLGSLAGYQTVAAAIACPELRQLIDQMMRLEIVPTLDMPAAQLDAYCTALLKRFANPGLQHLTQQIAMDGSQKIPQRLLATIRAARCLGLSCERLLLGVACWVRYVAGVDEHNRPVSVLDPLQPLFAEAASQLPDSDRFCDAILDLQQVFDTDLSQAQWFRQALKEKVSTLFSEGVVATLKRHCEGVDH